MSTNDSLKKIASGASILLVGAFLSKILSYVYRLIVARIGVDQYGLLSLALAILGILVTISMMGFNQGIVRYIAYYKGKEDYSKIKGTIVFALKITLSISLVLGILVFLFSEDIAIKIFQNSNLAQILKIIIFALPLTVLSTILIGVIEGFQKVKYEVLSKNVGENIVKISLTLILIFLGYNLLGAVIAYVIASLVTLILTLYFVQKKIFPFLSKKIIALDVKKELIKYSWPLTLTGVIMLVIAWTDTIMLGLFKSSYDVGIYNASLPTAQILYIVPYALSILFLPVLTELFAKKEMSTFRSTYKTTTKWIFMTNIILLALFVMFPDKILSLLFGSNYIEGSGALIILSIGFFVHFLSANSSNILLTLGRTKIYFLNALIVALVNVGLNFLLIPKYGLIGAAIATGSAAILMTILSFSETIYITKIFPFKLNYINIMISAIIAIFATKWTIDKITLNLFSEIIIAIIILTLIYIILLILTRSFEKEDKEIIKHLFGKLSRS
tara:strand:- start:21346 stop:22848 length:1503 start_codon:yes stop_codon:yes gene_type:complete